MGLQYALEIWHKQTASVARSEEESRFLELTLTEHMNPLQTTIRRVAYENLMSLFNMWFNNRGPILEIPEAQLYAKEVLHRSEVTWALIMEIARTCLAEAVEHNHEKYWQVEGAVAFDNFVAVWVDLVLAHLSHAKDAPYRVLMNTMRKLHPEQCLGHRIEEEYVQ
jgi:hypothetical protein